MDAFEHVVEPHNEPEVVLLHLVVQLDQCLVGADARVVVRFVLEELVIEQNLSVTGIFFVHLKRGGNVFAEAQHLAYDCAAACTQLEHVLARHIAFTEESFS